MAKILVVEDHESLRHSIQALLETEGYQTCVAATAKDAYQNACLAPDLIVLDWMLPDGQGIDVLTRLRQNGLTAPVIFLTARTDTLDKVLGLELGADDYMTKPFEPRELIARIRARLRETVVPSSALKVGAVVIDRVRRVVTFRDREIQLVKKEFDLLVLLAESPGKVFSREEILNKVWGYDVFPTTRTVDTHVLQLRRKIQDELIETVRSVGYKLTSI